MKYLHVYRTESGKWSGLIMVAVDGFSGSETPLEALLEARSLHPDVIDLPGAKALQKLRAALAAFGDNA